MKPTDPRNELRKLKPESWCEIFGLIVCDPDGWNRQAKDWNAEWNRPLTLDEFRSKASQSTTKIVDPVRHARLYPELAYKQAKPLVPKTVAWMPLCWKCAHGLFANNSMSLKNGARCQEYKGCALESLINDYADAQFLCPIKPR